MTTYTPRDIVSIMQEILHDVVHFYQYVVIERVPGPRSISYFLPFILLPVALMIPPSRLSRQWLTILFVPLITASTVHAWIAMGGVDVISADLLLESLHLIWFENVRVVYRRVIRERVGKESDRGLTGKALDEQSEARPQTKDPNRVEGVNKLPAPIAGVKSHDEPYPTDIMARLRWVGNLVSSTRGNGWKIGSKNHDARQSNLPQPPTRMAFALALIPGMIRNSLLLSLTTLFSRYDPYFNDAGSISVSTPYPRSPTYHEKPMIISILQIIPPPILRPMVIGLTAYSILTLGYYVPAPLAVASNYYLGIPNDDWSPHTNGRYFGPFSSVLDLGVRGVWGRWWHDQMRIVTSAPGESNVYDPCIECRLLLSRSGHGRGCSLPTTIILTCMLMPGLSSSVGKYFVGHDTAIRGSITPSALSQVRMRFS